MAFVEESSNKSLKKQDLALLLIDDETVAKDVLEFALMECPRGLANLERLRILYASTLGSALKYLEENQVHIALLDKNLGPNVAPQDRNGIEAIPDMLKLQPHLQILVVSGSKDTSDAARAMDLGAAGYISKDKPQELLVAQINRFLQNSLDRIQALRVNRGLNDESLELGGRSKVFQRVLKDAAQVAATSRPVILFGETGTGKTEIAKWMHKSQNEALKKERPFFGINVATLSKEAIGNELFGHERGAYTDAVDEKPGLFELAENGTLFLDEIGEMPLDLQILLLKVIEEGTFMRMSGKRVLTTNAKLIFATHRDLRKMVDEGMFREDLYHRITYYPIQVPSLSERREDIPDIVRAMLPKSCAAARVHVRFEDLPGDFLEYLTQQPVVGNIRGIQHQLERLLVFSPKDKHGKPVLSRWRSIPGFGTKVPDAPKVLPKSEDLSSVPLTYSELLRRPWSFLNSDFPGINKALVQIKEKILAEAFHRFKTNRDRAKVLQISESKSSLIFQPIKNGVVRSAEETSLNLGPKEGL